MLELEIEILLEHDSSNMISFSELTAKNQTTKFHLILVSALGVEKVGLSSASKTDIQSTENRKTEINLASSYKLWGSIKLAHLVATYLNRMKVHFIQLTLTSSEFLVEFSLLQKSSTKGTSGTL